MTASLLVAAAEPSNGPAFDGTGLAAAAEVAVHAPRRAFPARGHHAVTGGAVASRPNALLGRWQVDAGSLAEARASSGLAVEQLVGVGDLNVGDTVARGQHRRRHQNRSHELRVNPSATTCCDCAHAFEKRTQSQRNHSGLS